MADFVERRRQVRVKGPQAFSQGPVARRVDNADRVLAAAARPESIGSWLKPGLPLRLQCITYPCLMTPVRNYRDGDFILPLLQSRLG